METFSYKCPNCDAPLIYGNDGRMKCEFCDGTFDIDAVKAYNENKAKSDTEKAERKQKEFAENCSAAGTGEWNAEEIEHIGVLTCPTCGGELIFDKQTAASSCPYCGNPALVYGSLSGQFKPDTVLPFKITKKAAEDAYRGFIKGKKLAPKSFSTESRIKEIKGIYIPFWLYHSDAEASGTFNAIKEYTTRGKDANTIRTDYHTLTRSGSMTFDNLPVDASERMPDSLMDSIEPFDFSTAADFNTAYLSGYFADRYDVSQEASNDRAQRRMYNTAADRLCQTARGNYDSVSVVDMNIKYKNISAKYALLPVWLLISEYAGKKYTYAMNGQTGKFVGEVPVSKQRFWSRVFGITAVLGIIIFLIYLLLTMGG